MMPKSSLAINMPSLTIVQASSPSLSSSFEIYVLSTTAVPVPSLMRTTPVLSSRTAVLSSSIATSVSASPTTKMPPLSVTLTEMPLLSAAVTEVSSLKAAVTEVPSLSTAVTPMLSSTPERSSSGRASLVILSSSATKPVVSSSSIITSTSTTSTTTKTSTAKPTPSVATAGIFFVNFLRNSASLYLLLKASYNYQSFF